MSWRLMGRKSTKPTGESPTKSAVVGILTSALGGQRSNRELIAEVASNLRMASYHLTPLRRGSLLEDYQTVGCRGKMDTEEDDAPFTAIIGKNGKRERNGIITRRYYLTDETFFVILSGPSEKIDRYWEAIRYPRYPLFLGTACCLPSERIDVGVFDSEKEAMDVVSNEAKRVGLKELHCVRDVDDIAEANDVIPDYPHQFGLASGGYGRRPVRSEMLEVE